MFGFPTDYHQARCSLWPTLSKFAYNFPLKAFALWNDLYTKYFVLSYSIDVVAILSY